MGLHLIVSKYQIKGRITLLMVITCFFIYDQNARKLPVAAPVFSGRAARADVRGRWWLSFFSIRVMAKAAEVERERRAPRSPMEFEMQAGLA